MPFAAEIVHAVKADLSKFEPVFHFFFWIELTILETVRTSPVDRRDAPLRDGRLVRFCISITSQGAP